MNEIKTNNLIFKRGYLITDSYYKFEKSGWIKVKIGNYNIFFDELNDYVHIKRENTWLFILGNMIDTINQHDNLESIGRKLLVELESNIDNFYNYLDVLSGRYIILFNDGHLTNILSDATGMKSIVYSTDKTIIASHVYLVKKLVNAERNEKIKDEWIKKYKAFRYPGHFTPFKNIYHLTPNTLLKIETKEIVRYFPREDIKLQQIDTIVNEISELVKNQIKLITQKDYELIFSLTAGIDSRTTLSLLKDYISNIQFFTYYKISEKLPLGVKSLEIDRKVVSEMATNLNLNHMFVPLNEDVRSNEYDKFVKLMKTNTLKPHSYRLAKFYLDNLPNEAIHIRSNILEIGRYFYRERMKLPKQADAKSLTMCYSPLSVENKEIISLFSEYYKAVKMEDIYNYDPFDILYWEYRMGTWHSQLLLESDVAHETFIPFNSRNILKLLLSVSDVDKKNNTIFKHIIAKNWPILNYWGINTLEKPIEKIDDEIDNYGSEIKSMKFTTNANDAKVQSKNYGKKAKFYLDKSAPEKGEYASALYQFKTHKDKAYMVLLHVRSPYESTKHFGRMKYQVLLNGKVLIEEDISKWKETNQVHLQFLAESENTKLEVKVVATQNCEAWNWGKAGTIIIERISIRNSSVGNLKVKVSSPYSKLYY